jgi:tRNA(fMet)-specific endonuclease VapC
VTSSFVIDTNIAIDLRDQKPGVAERVEALEGDVWLSIVSRIELEGGTYRDAGESETRGPRLAALLRFIPCCSFDDRDADAYREIVRRAGFSRRKVVDRMIAAQAFARDARLVTRNAGDFREISGLHLLEW